MSNRFLSLSNDSFRGTLWAIFYSLLVVTVPPLAIWLGSSRYAIAALALVVLPFVASLMVHICRKMAGERQ